MKAKAHFERWMWIELIGFDRDQDDYGVEAFCDRAGFIPDAISLLLSDPEFVHGHTGRLSRILGAGVCSYGGHPYNEERRRQAWKGSDLKGLIQKLQSTGISVYFTHFDAPMEGWLQQHPELRVLYRTGEWLDMLSPYKRLSNGQSYREFYLPLLERVMTDYGFDGFHAGDGMAHPRLPIYEGDFSVDTISQYLEKSGDTLPKKLANWDDEGPSTVRDRAAWIWRERRGQWIQFHRDRATEFWGRVATMLKGHGKKLAFNTCWTRDPFEALYRYGVDHPALHQAGVDVFIAETSSAVHEFGGDLSYGEVGSEPWEPRGTLQRFSINLQLLRAAVPEAKIIFMNGIKDTNEAWNGIRHAPTNLESEIFSHTGTFAVTGKKTLRPAADGVISVLSDGLSSAEWKWIRDRWDLGFSLQPTSYLGAAVFWGESFHEKLAADYVTSRHVPMPEILARLTLAGAPLLATVRAEHLSQWNGVIVVVHPHLVTKSEWQQLTMRSQPLITVGGPAPQKASKGFHFEYGVDSGKFEVSIFHGKGARLKMASLPEPEDFSATAAEDPFQWLMPLPAASIPEAFYAQVAQWIVTATEAIRIPSDNPDVRAWAYRIPGRKLRIYARNESFYYRHCALEVPVPCGKVKTLTAFPGNPVAPEKNILRFKMAGKSMAVFDVPVARPRAER